MCVCVASQKYPKGLKKAFRIDYNASKFARFVHLLTTEEMELEQVKWITHTHQEGSLARNLQIH